MVDCVEKFSYGFIYVLFVNWSTQNISALLSVYPNFGKQKPVKN